MRYMQVPTEEAEKLSAALYELTRPAIVREPKDITTHYCGWYVHPDDPSLSVLEMPVSARLPIHKLADSKAVKDVFLALQAGADVDDKVAAIDAVIGSVDSKKEQAIDINDVMPGKLITEALSREQAIVAGWIKEPKSLLPNAK